MDTPRYLRMGDILNKNFFFLRSLSHFVDQAEYDSLANSSLILSEKGGCILPLIDAIVASEFERNVRTPGSIMRGNCVASKLMGAYSRHNGKEFLKKCVGDLVLEVVNKGPEHLLEINPSQLSGENVEEKLENNQKELQKLAESFISRILSPETLEIMPRGIRAIAGFTAEYARKYASDRLCPLVGGFLMLRLFNPSLITPESVGLLPEGVRPSKEARRNLTLISKILQNLSNGLLFGAKEPYMTCMNNIIEKYTDDFKAFLYKVADDDQSEKEPWAACKNVSPVPLQKNDFFTEKKSFMVIHALLATFRGRLLEKLHEEVVMINIASGVANNYDEEEELFQLLDELPEPDLKKKISSQEVQKEITFLTKTLKSGQLSKKKGKFLKKETPHRLVLTENFGHFFSSPEEKKPFQSVPIIELVTSLVDENETLFRFGFSDKFFEIQCESSAQVKDWVSTVARSQSRKHNSTVELGKRELTALERRILNHLSGVQVKFSAQSLGWEPTADGTVVFIVQVRAFGNVWYLRKKWGEYLQLNELLSSSFPHFIFPSFPPLYEEEREEEGGGGGGEGGEKEKSFRRKMTPASIPPPHSPPVIPPLSSSSAPLSPRHIPSVRPSPPPTSPISPPISPPTSPPTSPCPGPDPIEGDSAGVKMRAGQLLICMEGDKPSRGTIFGSNFLSGYLSDLTQNGTLAQSSELFEFLELSNLRRVIEESSREQLQLLMRKQIDINQSLDGMSPLHMAVYFKKVSAVRMLCDCGAIVDTRDTNRNTPLHIACKLGLVKVVKELVMLGGNLEAKNSQNQTPFFLACEFGHTDVVDFLMSNGVSTVVLDNNQQTAVSVATSEGHQGVVVSIAGKREDHEWEDDASFRYQDGSTLLHMAACLGLPDLFSSLLENLGIDVNTQSHLGVTALHQAAKKGTLGVVEIILGADSVDPSLCDSLGRTPLFLAVLEGHLEVVKLLLPVTDTTTKTNQEESLLFLAINGGFVEIVEEIIKTNPKMIIEERNKEGEDPLTVAIQNGEEGVARVLVKALKGEETEGKNPLYLAVLVGNEEILKFLLENGANPVDYRTEEGLSLLHVACYSNSPTIAHLLLQAGVNINHPDPQGNTPVHLSSLFSLPSLLDVLLEGGGGEEGGNEEGDTALHLACLGQSMECLKKLIQDNESAIFTKNKQGCSPLHIAAQENFVDGAIFLTKNGAEISQKNKKKETPLSLASPALKKMMLEAAGKEEE